MRACAQTYLKTNSVLCLLHACQIQHAFIMFTVDEIIRYTLHNIIALHEELHDQSLIVTASIVVSNIKCSYKQTFIPKCWVIEFVGQ